MNRGIAIEDIDLLNIEHKFIMTIPCASRGIELIL